MPDKFLNPAEVVVRAFGGVRPLARLLDLSPAAVTHWRKAKRGAGRVPAKQQVALLALAKARGIRLTPDDLIVGRKVRG